MLTGTHILMAIGAALALVVIAAFLAYRKEARLSVTIIGQFMLTIAVPVLAIFGACLWILSRFVTIDTSVRSALVAGIFIATGWLTTAIFSEIGRLRERQEKTRDFHRAIFAEIGNNLSNIWDIKTIRSHADAMIERMQADADFVPLIPRERNSTLFNLLAAEIHILPRQTIDPIVAYYAQVDAIAALAEDMRSNDFRLMAQPRRIAMYSDYIQMKRQVLEFGRYANFKIDEYENGAIKAARRAGQQINNPAEAPSGRLQE